MQRPVGEEKLQRIMRREDNIRSPPLLCNESTTTDETHPFQLSTFLLHNLFCILYIACTVMSNIDMKRQLIELFSQSQCQSLKFQRDFDEIWGDIRILFFFFRKRGMPPIPLLVQALYCAKLAATTVVVVAIILPLG